MSFSSDLKFELSQIDNKDCCAAAEAYGLMLFGRSFSRDEISIMTEHDSVAQRYSEAVALIINKAPLVKRSASGKITVLVNDKNDCLKILNFFGYSANELKLRLNMGAISESCCCKAFLRGAFMSCGTVTDPEKEYHLEFSVLGKSLAYDFKKYFEICEACLDENQELNEEGDEVVNLIQSRSISPGLTQRKGAYVLYFKDSSSIEDVLTLMGAVSSSMTLMGVKVLKDIRNNVNRKMNFDGANINRSVEANLKQNKAVKKIERTIGLNSLSPDLQHIARLRLDNPEMTLKELSEATEGRLTRSAVSYRLNKLIEIAEKI